MKTNKFKLGNFHLTTCEMGRLVPVGIQEVLPGDIFSLRTSIFVRMLPMIAPVMHPIIARIHHFFVPNRILWRFWGDFIASSPKARDMVVPSLLVGNNPQKNTLTDYFNLPLKSGMEVVAFPYLAYLLIWKEFFADDQLNADMVSEIDDFLNKVYESKGGDVGNITIGGTTISLGQLKAFVVAWSKDYFTSARNEPQLGDDVVIPVHAGASADGTISLTNPKINNLPLQSSYIKQETMSGDSAGNDLGYYAFATHPTPPPTDMYRNVGATTFNSNLLFNKIDGETDAQFYERVTQKYKDFKNTQVLTADGILNKNGQNALAGQGISLQELRNSLALGRINEHRNMYGTRFVEYLNYLGVKTSDYRLQRPLLLGSGRSMLQISEVLQTAEATGGVVGSMKGHGIGTLSSNRCIRGFEEHGFILSLVSFVPKTIYTDGISKMWSRKIAYDYWQKELQNLGMQPIKNKEVFFQNKAADEEVFGYQDIWQEYRTNQSRISGDFRDLFNDWHLSREFTALPALNKDFIACNPTKRIFAEQTTNPLLLMCRNFAVARRLVSKRANPKTF